nr:hypothetical protein MtrunA17_Chr7g0252831 [Ipomoea batatas]
MSEESKSREAYHENELAKTWDKVTQLKPITLKQHDMTREFMGFDFGTKGNFATGFPSNRLLRKPKTRNRTTATTNPDLNLKSERSRLDSLSEVSTRSIFLVLDFLVVRKAAGLDDSRVFMVSSFLEALSMVDFRDL